MEFETLSYEETKERAKEFAKTLDKGSVICLYGDLGAGKTAFVQGVAEGLEIEEYITSPTFTIVNMYESGRLTLYHFDVYRIADVDEMYELGYEEYVYGDGVSIIEWPQLIEEILPCERINIHIEKDMEKDINYRRIIIEKV